MYIYSVGDVAIVTIFILSTVCLYIYIYTCICIHLQIHTCMYRYIYMPCMCHTYTPYIYICMYVLCDDILYFIELTSMQVIYIHTQSMFIYPPICRCTYALCVRHTYTSTYLRCYIYIHHEIYIYIHTYKLYFIFMTRFVPIVVNVCF